MTRLRRGYEGQNLAPHRTLVPLVQSRGLLHRASCAPIVPQRKSICRGVESPWAQKGRGSPDRSWYGSSSFSPLKAILRGFHFGTGGANVISAGLLIKYSPHSRGQTFKSNIFLHSNDPNLQKSTTIGQVRAICGVYSHIHSTPGKPKEEHSIPQQPERQKHK
ncbi:hypothetical protein APT58_10810 [Corynebacterium glutamicum]|nr:hypothetical protein APT58_10810 [Corynebacterium glutamicum]